MLERDGTPNYVCTLPSDRVKGYGYGSRKMASSFPESEIEPWLKHGRVCSFVACAFNPDTGETKYSHRIINYSKGWKTTWNVEDSERDKNENF